MSSLGPKVMQSQASRRRAEPNLCLLEEDRVTWGWLLCMVEAEHTPVRVSDIV